MTLEMGKAVAESKAEIAYAAEFFRWFSGEALRIDGYYKTAGNGASRVLVMRQPVGPCFFITPWNFPNAMGTRKIGPAIAAGCTMVVKPAKLTPLSMIALAQLLEECGLPPRRPQHHHQLVVGRRSPGPVIADPRLRKLSFTGSTEVGRKLIAQAADERAQGLDGARRQRPVPRLRGRRPRRGGRGRDDRQDAQRRRGLHVGQPLPRRSEHRRRVRRRSSPSGWAP